MTNWRKRKILLMAFTLLVIGLMHSNMPLVNAELKKDFSATAYYCVYESEMDGTEKVTKTISGKQYTLKASFLFGGHGVAMQGTGRTDPNGDYIHYDGSGGKWLKISEMTEEQKKRYEDLGVTDFTGFGGIALEYPGNARYSKVSGFIGASGRALIAWYSIAVDPTLIPLGTTGTLLFQSGTTPQGKTSMSFRADDTGGLIVGKKIDVYVGEGNAALQTWYNTGGNRIVHVQLPQFGIDVSPSSGTIAQGNSGTATVQISSKGGYSKTVSLSASGQPSGVAIAYNPISGTPDFTSSMTITVGNDVLRNTYLITIKGTGTDGKTNSTTYTLTVTPAVPEFPLGNIELLLGVGIIIFVVIRMKRAKSLSSLDK